MNNEKRENGNAETSTNSNNRFVYSRLNAACWLILIHELLERFAFYGMKGLLTLFLKDYLHFPSGVATSIYHLFSGIAYLIPLVGAIISDNYLGKFRTVVIFGIVYLIGLTTLSLSTLSWNRIGPLLGLFTIAVGTGIIKPCVAAFGGDQTPLNDNEATEAFFSLFYVCINVGAFVSQLLTPILKERVNCVDGQCYPLAFGVPAAAFLLTYVIFVAMRPLCRFADGEDNVFLRSMQLIKHSISRKIQFRKSGDKRESFLDYGDDKYDSKFINEVKIVLSVLVLYLPFPIFWALFDQQGSRWSVQASQMDGQITESLLVYPEQMQMINPLLIIIIIPIFNNIVYPLTNKCNVFTRPTTRMVVGYIFAALSFVYAGVLQFQIDGALVAPTLPSGQSSLQLVNMGRCRLSITPPRMTKYDLRPSEVVPVTKLDAPSSHMFSISSPSCGMGAKNVRLSLAEMSKYTIGIADKDESSIVTSSVIQDRMINPKGSKLRFMASLDLSNRGGAIEMVKGKDSSGIVVLDFSNCTSSRKLCSSKYLSVPYGSTRLLYRRTNSSAKDIMMLPTQPGLIATIALNVDISSSNISSVTINEVKSRLWMMPWQIPQYILMTIGEVLFSVTSMAFAYSESPTSMKAIMQSVYLVTIFFGNMIVTIVAALPSLPNQSWEFLLFAGLVVLAGILQAYLAYSFEKNKRKRLQKMQIEKPENDDDVSVEPADVNTTKL